MKRTVSIAGIIILLFSFISCSGLPINDSSESEIDLPDPSHSTPSASSVNEVQINELPSDIQVIVKNYNTVSSDPKDKIGIASPIYRIASDYNCTINTFIFSFTESDTYISIHVSSTEKKELRDLNLHTAFMRFSFFVFSSFDLNENNLDWIKMRSGERVTRDGVVMMYLSSDNSDTIVFIVPSGLVVDYSSK